MSVEAYKAALILIEPRITEGQRKMLIGHYHAPGKMRSVTQLAELAEYKGAAPGKLHYGKLARNLAETMGTTPPTTDQTSILAHWTDEENEHGHGQWIMRSELAKALEELGWV